jgi:cold shock CspA family protein
VGKVLFFNNQKGWGLIEGTDGAIYFIHHSGIVDKKFDGKNGFKRFRTLKPGQSVKFEPVDIGHKYKVARSLILC